MFPKWMKSKRVHMQTLWPLPGNPNEGGLGRGLALGSLNVTPAALGSDVGTPAVAPEGETACLRGFLHLGTARRDGEGGSAELGLLGFVVSL